MSPSTYVRRGGTVQANPNSVSGLVARYRASDVSGLTNGASLTAWPDVSGNSNDLSVLSNAPTKQTDGSSLPLVRFTAASSQSMSKNSPTGLPTTGPFTVIAVANFVGTGNQVMVEYAGTSNAGWAATLGGGSYSISNYSNDTPTSIGPAAGAVNLHTWVLASNSTTVSARRNNRKNATTGTTGGLFAGSRTRLTVGRADFFPTWALGADVYEVCVWNRLLTDQEMDSLRGYWDATYGLKLTGSRYVATAAQTTSPTADGSNSCVEVSVLYFPAGWNTHKYWMSFVPLGAGSAANENPHIFHGDDGVTWSSSGVTNPVVPARASGNNADPHLFDNTARDGKIYLYWSAQQDVTPANNGVWAITSTDGVTWSSPVQVNQSSSGLSNQEATVRWDGTQYVLYTQNSTSFVVTRRTSANPLSFSGAGTAINISIPGGRSIWHHDFLFANGKWYYSFSDNDAVRNLWLATSPDGINFVCAKRPVLVLSSGWDSPDGSCALYRPSLLPPDDTTTNWRCWYTGGDVGNGNVHLGYGEFPEPEFP